MLWRVLSRDTHLCVRSVPRMRGMLRANLRHSYLPTRRVLLYNIGLFCPTSSPEMRMPAGPSVVSPKTCLRLLSSHTTKWPPLVRFSAHCLERCAVGDDDDLQVSLKNKKPNCYDTQRRESTGWWLLQEDEIDRRYAHHGVHHGDHHHHVGRPGLRC